MPLLIADPIGCSCDIVNEGRLGQAYNEEGFQYLLARERKRSMRSARPFLLLLVGSKGDAGWRGLDPVIGRRLFSGLWRCLRETDVVGWFREGRLVGAVLPQFTDPRGEAVRCLIGERVRATLDLTLSPEIVTGLRVRIFQMPFRTGDRS